MLKKVFLLSLGLAFLAGCNTKFNVNGDFKETPIVHFLLDQGQDYQFLKLNRTFLKEGNANDFAKEAELSYFDNVVAIVEEVKNGSVQRSWTLEDTTIQNKKEGAFYGPEQKLYFFKVDKDDDNEKLDEEAVYRLKIDIDNGNHTVTGQTELIKGVGISYPSQNVSFRFAESDVPMNGFKSTPVTYTKSPDASVFNVQLRFDYREDSPSGPELKSVFWTIGEANNANVSTNSGTFFAKGEMFYEMLKQKIEVDPAVTKRIPRGVEIIVTAGSSDLYTYMLTNEPTSSLAQNKPTYSNVDGALGIFSSRVTFTQYKAAYNGNVRALDENSTKELCEGQITSGLKFCSDNPGDNSKSYYCN